MRCDGCGRFDPMGDADDDRGGLPRGWVTLHATTSRRPYDARPLEGTPVHACSPACGERAIRQSLDRYRAALFAEDNAAPVAGPREVVDPEARLPREQEFGAA